MYLSNDYAKVEFAYRSAQLRRSAAAARRRTRGAVVDRRGEVAAQRPA